MIGVLVNPKNANADLETKDAKQAAQSLGLDLIFANAQTVSEIENTFLRFREGPSIAGLLVASDAFLNLHAKEIAQIALQYRLPTCFSYREPVVAGGLMAYGANRPDAYRRAGNYVGRILHGAKAGDLPVEQPTKIRVRSQSKDSQGAGAQRAILHAVACRRSNRIGENPVLLLLHTSAFSRFCCKSRLRHGLERDSVALTRIAARSFMMGRLKCDQEPADKAAIAA